MSDRKIIIKNNNSVKIKTVRKPKTIHTIVRDKNDDNKIKIKTSHSNRREEPKYQIIKLKKQKVHKSIN
jgi:hypothetical protein